MELPSVDELADRVRRTLDRAGSVLGDWEDVDQLALTIAIDIEREFNPT
jgi:hypothetical protein